jgi:hypothetical protein
MYEHLSSVLVLKEGSFGEKGEKRVAAGSSTCVVVPSSQIHSPCRGDIVDSAKGLSYRPASLCSLARRASTTTQCQSWLYHPSQGQAKIRHRNNALLLYFHFYSSAFFKWKSIFPFLYFSCYLPHLLSCLKLYKNLFKYSSFFNHTFFTGFNIHLSNICVYIIIFVYNLFYCQCIW